MGLAREKPYPSIAVKEILDRANVGRSTFYTHFRDKDDLLENGIHEVLRSIRDQPQRGPTLERVIAFSLPILQHINEHRQAAGPKMGREGRVIMHEHLENVLGSLIGDELVAAVPSMMHRQISPDLIARYV